MLNTKIPADKLKIIGTEDDAAELLARPPINFWKDAWRRFKMNKIAVVALIVLTVLALMCVFAPMLSQYNFEELDNQARNQDPSAAHWFGTDKLGRDMWTRVWVGGRVSMVIGLTGALISMGLGCLYGGIAAYFGGLIDTIMMRIVEVLISVPYLIVVILMSVVLDSKDLGTLLLAMCITGWCGTARFVRSEMLRIKSEEFTLAAQLLGVSPWKIVVRHFIPNTISIIIVNITFSVPSYIFSEAFLSYMGLGIQPPGTSWGALASMAQSQYQFYPYLLFWPVLMIALTMLCFTLIGEGMRDALDPKARK
jgi:oligopeptide transport system permease protein